MQKTFRVFVVLSLIALAFGAMYFIGTANQDLALRAEGKAEKPLTVPVTQGEVVVSTSMGAVASKPSAMSVKTGKAGTITRLEIEPGTDIDNGDVLFEIDGNPIVAVDPELFVPYRKLEKGVKGNDVLELQRFLASLDYYTGAEDGKMEAGTVAAVRAFYADRGVEKVNAIEFDRFIFVRPGSHVVSVTKQRGAVVASGDEILLVEDGTVWLTGNADAEVAKQFPIGTEVEIPVDETVVGGAVIPTGQTSAASSSAQSASTTGSGNTSVLVTVLPDVDTAISVGSSYSVRKVVERSEPDATIVPALAVRTDQSSKTYVVVTSGGNDVGTQVPVEVLTSDGTLAAVDGDLKVGDLVEVRE